MPVWGKSGKHNARQTGTWNMSSGTARWTVDPSPNAGRPHFLQSVHKRQQWKHAKNIFSKEKSLKIEMVFRYQRCRLKIPPAHWGRRSSWPAWRSTSSASSRSSRDGWRRSASGPAPGSDPRIPQSPSWDGPVRFHSTVPWAWTRV